MATDRYVCNKCEWLVEVDSHRKRVSCPICGSDISLHMFFGGVVGKKLYGWVSVDSSGIYTVPEGVESIEDKLFLIGRDLKRIILPKTLKSIGKEAFQSCENLSNIIIPDSVASIGSSAFSYCEKLESIILPKSLKSISNKTFQSCENLSNVIIPDSVTSIGSNAFWNCKSLSFVNIPESVKELGSTAFEWTAFSRIYLPETIESIGDGCFNAIHSPVFYVVPGSYAHDYVKANHLDFKTCSRINGMAIKDDIIVDEGTKSIEAHFFENIGMKSISLPSSIQTIMEYAFAGCDDLTAINLPDGLTRIGSSAFKTRKKSVKVSSITIPKSVSEIGDHAFSGRQLKRIVLRSGIKVLGKGAFSDAIIDSIDLPDTVVDVSPDAFNNSTLVTVNGVALHVWAKKQQQEKEEAAEASAIDMKRNALNHAHERSSENTKNTSEIESSINKAEARLRREREKLEDCIKALEESTETESSFRNQYTSSLASMKAKLAELQSASASLREQLSGTFFLNLSKKKELRDLIDAREAEIREQSEQISSYSAKMDKEARLLKQAQEDAQKSKDDQERLCEKTVNDIESIKARKSVLEKEQLEVSGEIVALRKDLQSLESKHEQNARRRAAELDSLEKEFTEKKAKAERERHIEKLEAEKNEIVKCFDLKVILDSGIKQSPVKHTGPDETLLNTSYQKLVDSINESNTIRAIKTLVEKNADKLTRLAEINLELEKAEYDGIDPMLFADNTAYEWITSDYPERVAELSKLFAANYGWTELKKLIKSSPYGKMLQKSDPHSRFFAGQNTAFIHCDNNSELVLLPYCVIIFAKGSDMAQSFYKPAIASYECEEFESEKDEPNCEEIGKRYLHENKDGSKSMRFIHNPMIHKWRKTKLVFRCPSGKSIIKSALTGCTKSEAEELVNALDAYAAFLSDPTNRGAYDAVKAFKETGEIKAILNAAGKELKELDKREKALRAAEREATEHEAKEKRKQLIAKQRMRNEEKRLDGISEAKTGAEIEPAVKAKDTVQKPAKKATDGLTLPTIKEALKNADKYTAALNHTGLILASKNRAIFNNLFSLDFLFKSDPEQKVKGNRRTVLMTDADGDTISNTVTIPVENNEKYHIALTLKQNSFDKQSKYYLVVLDDSKGVVESLTEFKIDIAFSNDFDDDFGMSSGLSDFEEQLDAGNASKETEFAADNEEKVDEEMEVIEESKDTEQATAKSLVQKEEAIKAIVVDDKSSSENAGAAVLRWTPEEKLISVPASFSALPEETSFCELSGCIVEIPQKIWADADFMERYVINSELPEYCQYADLIFKVIIPDGRYYYAFLDYQDCYGEYINYRQVVDQDESDYSDEYIDDELLRDFDKEVNTGLKVVARLCRVATPYLLLDKLKEKFITYLRKYAIKAIEDVANYDCPELLETLYRIGALKGENSTAVLAALKEKKAEKCIADFERISSVEPQKIVIAKPDAKPAVKKSSISSFPSDYAEHHPGLTLQKSMKRNPVQVSLENGKKFNYLCRFPVAEEDRVIIGCALVSYDNESGDASKNTGLSGIVTNCSSVPTIKKKYAVEIAFAFSTNSQRIDLKECVKMVESPSSDEVTVSLLNGDKVYPITFMVRRMLAALTLLDYSDYVGSSANRAKQFLNETHDVPEEILETGYSNIGSKEWVSIDDMKSSQLHHFSEAFANGKPEIKNGYVDQEAIASIGKAFSDYFDEYVLLGTAEILLRCDLDNLFMVYLDNCARIHEYRDSLLEMAKELSATKCMELL